jgi:hypothetical protein
MSQGQVMGYGYVSDTDESLKTKSGANFGLNAGLNFLTKFAYSPNVAKEGDAPREAIEISLKIGDKEFKDWINPITKVVDKDNVEITDKTSAAYINGFNALMMQQNALVTHYLKSVGVTEEAIKASFSASPITSFADYGQRATALLPANYGVKQLDVFLEYQWNFGTNKEGQPNTRTFPTLPRNMKGGYFLAPAQPGTWTQEVNPDGSILYKNAAGQVHPFQRDANFMKSNKGTQQVFGQAPGAAAGPMGAPGTIPTATAAGTPQPTTNWS